VPWGARRDGVPTTPGSGAETTGSPAASPEWLRAELGIALYEERVESPIGAQCTPVLRGCGHLDACDVADDCVDVAVCPCGEEHPAVETAYGVRAQCDELGVRWTATLEPLAAALELRQHRVWVAEPYDTMATRSTQE
jgi:hypothetical protein